MQLERFDRSAQLTDTARAANVGDANYGSPLAPPTPTKEAVLNRMNVLATLVYLASAPAFAQADMVQSPRTGPADQATARELAKDYGTDRNWSSLDSFGVIPNSNGFVPNRSSTSGMFCSAGTDSRVVGQLQVPHGVLLDLIRVFGWDSSTDNMNVSLRSACLPDFSGDTPTLTPLASITSSGTGGAFSSSIGLASNTISDNQSCTYQVTVRLGPDNVTCSAGDLGFYKVRMQWYRQTPPGPAVATFSDVPTSHPFYNFIEALAASGITAGCTGTTFCPDAPLTRAQMAAFLARGFGLPLQESIPDPANP